MVLKRSRTKRHLYLFLYSGFIGLGYSTWAGIGFAAMSKLAQFTPGQKEIVRFLCILGGLCGGCMGGFPYSRSPAELVF